ncbi:MAG: hypothetical protein KGJ59_09525 [Bacteroidota bacterium]|nr:hypothetical protein [Bacteroidota bacterium]
MSEQVKLHIVRVSYRSPSSSGSSNVCKRLIFFLVINISLPVTATYGQDLKTVVDSLNAISYQYIVSHLHKSISIFSKNVEKAKASGYISGEGKALSQLGLAHYLRGNYEQSTECYMRAFQIFEDEKDYASLAGSYGEYGYQLKQRDLPKGVRYMQMAIALAEEKSLGDDLKCKLYDNYGVLKEMQGDYDGAMHLYKTALSMKMQRNDSVGIPYSLNKIANLYALEKKYSAAYSYVRQSDQYRVTEEGDFGRAENVSLWGDIFLMEGKADSSIQKYRQALQLATSLDYGYLQQYCYQQLSEAYKLKKDFAQALKYYHLYTGSKDSVLNRQTRTTIAELEIDYETAEKNKLLTTQEFQLRQRTLLLIIAAGSIVFLIVLFTWTYKHQMQKRERIKQEVEFKSRLKEAELENKISSEKLRISRELHDNIGSRLTFVISSLDNITFSNLSNGVSSKLNSLSNFGRETLDDLRNTIWAMKNEDGNVGQLILKINQLIQKLTANDDHIAITVEQHLPDTVRLSSVQMLNLFRIVQEALQNSTKHSHATKISICFEEFEKEVSLSIKDNGEGFDCNNVNAGNGIPNMKTRCEEASGYFQLHSCSAGTTVECRIRCV